MIMWAKDVARSIDYLQSRPDIAKGKIGHIALSADRTPLILAVEPRISLAVIYCGGFARQQSLPEVDPVNFAPRVKVPVLMLNGRYDYFYPTATSQEPHVQSSRHAGRTQAPRRLRIVTHDPAQ